MDEVEFQRQYDEYDARNHETERCISKVDARREALITKHGQFLGYLDMQLQNMAHFVIMSQKRNDKEMLLVTAISRICV